MESLLPLRVVGLAKNISDHAPLLVDYENNCIGAGKKLGFRNGG
jgi:hypothetical protein